MLNQYIWGLYKKSEGSKVIDVFHEGLYDRFSDEYIDMIHNLYGFYCANPEYVDVVRNDLRELKQNIRYNSSYEQTEKEIDLYIDGEDINKCFESFYDEVFQLNEQSTFQAFINSMEYSTTLLSIYYPGLFIPYYFMCNYNVITKIAEAFDIDLPEIPPKANHKARMWHYVELCKSLNAFRKENNLSLSELCAFLYDFAPQYIGGKKSYIVDDLPEPRSAFFIGGGGKNEDSVAEEDADSITRWQCNPDTRVGDMIVMYLRTPISAISSIWRARSVGFIDPFFWYYRCTYIGNPVKVKRIPIDKIKKDRVLKKMPIVKKNMQGINGVELKPSDYNYIVEKTKADVLKLENSFEVDSEEFPNEKAVEDKLIKPLIKKLGYEESEYKQQLYIEIGNHNYALIPDFVLSPATSKGHYSGYAIIEAKRSITSEKQMEETKTQARSYAKILGAKYSSIASQEGIWVTSSRDDYTKDVFSASWEELKNEDTLFELRKRIGNE
ncbi:Type I restriction enzyme R protein N terminus (HSDR_N) [Lachnospiraceae bacterium]|nr:Type I restriction enzyme R protein N terminus (HSDR_N) [Lachnospiraceae bacterium]